MLAKKRGILIVQKLSNFVKSLLGDLLLNLNRSAKYHDPSLNNFRDILYTSLKSADQSVALPKA